MSKSNPTPKDQTLFAKLVAHCLRTSCKCSPQATPNLNPRHDSTCPYTPNHFFKVADEYRQLKVRTFLNTIIAITPIPTPTPTPTTKPQEQASDIIAHQPGPPRRNKRVTFHTSVAKHGPQAPVEKNASPSFTTNNKCGVNTTPEQFHIPQNITPEIIEQLILCNEIHLDSDLPCPTCTFTDSEWTTYLKNLRLRLSDPGDPYQNPESELTSTSSIPILYALNRAVKIWVGQTILDLGGWDTSDYSSSSSPNSNVQKRVQPSWALIATREQIHLSHALSSLVANHLNSARLISHSLRKLKTEITRAAWYAERIIHLQGAVLRTASLGPGQTIHVDSQSLQTILLELHLSKARYLRAQTRVLQELGRLSCSVGGFRSEVERHLHQDVSPSKPDEPDPKAKAKVEAESQPQPESQAQPQPQPPLEPSGPPVALIRTALHELVDFAQYWPPNARRKVDFIYKLLGLVHEDVLNLQGEIEGMKVLWSNGLIIGSEDSLLRTVIRPSEAKVGRWCDAARLLVP